MNRSLMKKQAGTTLLETMGAFAVLATLVAVAVPSYDGHKDKMRMVEVQKDFGVFELRLQRYFAANGEYPPDLATVGLAKDDPWGNPYRYMRMSDKQGNGQVRKKHGDVPINLDFDLYSHGPDGDSVSPLTGNASRDDIVRGDDGGFVGWATDYCAKSDC